MTSDVVIRAEGLGKSYVIGSRRQSERYQALRDTVANAGRRFFDKVRGRASLAGETEEFWALKDVSFEVTRGEVLGVIGRNGAGKSTLLKVLSRITEPSEGRVTIRGRVASLLEVGTGFHPELTGRENIFLNGAILGMTRAEIRRKFDEIVAFAEVEKFLDTPVKRYSSGMYVRLAFAVAAHLEPEILVVDEVLAVGDAEFQKKCLGKMGEVAGEGRTVLFVSHNMGAMRALCRNALVLEKGSIALAGPTEGAIRRYLSSAAAGTLFAGRVASQPEKPVEIVEFSISDRFGNAVSSISADAECRILIRARNREPVRGARMVLTFTRSTGEVAFCSTDHIERDGRCDAEGEYRAEVTVPGNLLNAGTYQINLRVGQPGVRVLHADTMMGELGVVASGSHGSFFGESWPGAVAPKLSWQFRFGHAQTEEAERAAS